MELRANEPGVVSQLGDFHQSAVRRKAAEHHAVFFQHFAIRIVELEPVPVALDGPLGAGAETTIRFAEPEFGVAPGQAAVLYAGNRVIGGGWIEATEAV